MIVTQLAEFLNNTMIPQYLGKEAIKAEDLTSIVSVGATTMVEGPPVEPTKIASMKTSDYTAGTATIVNTRGETTFGALSSGKEFSSGPPDYETLTFSLSDCITQENDGIGIRYSGRITYPIDITEDDYIVTFTASISELTEISGIWSLISETVGIMGYDGQTENIIAICKGTYSNSPCLQVKCIYDRNISEELLFNTDIETANMEHTQQVGSLFVPFDDAGLSSSDLQDDVTFMLISVGGYIVISVNDVVICSIDKEHVVFGTGPYTIYNGCASIAKAGLSYTGTIKEFEIFKINEE